MVYPIRFIHLMSLVVWLGGMIFFSFIAAPSIFKVLPVETAGDVVGEIFPKYRLIGYICSLTALATLALLAIFEKTFPKLRVLVLVIMTATTFYSGLVVGSKARDIKTQIRVTEDGSEKAALKSKFQKIHRKAVILNVIVMVLGIVFLFITTISIRI